MKTFKYNSKLVGVTFEGRQAVISTLDGSETIRCRREPENEYDANAVAVDVLKNEEWLPIGYIAKDKNQEIAKSMDGGEEVNITLSNITGGSGKSFGINIALQYNEAKPAQVVQKPSAPEVIQPTRDELKASLEYLLKVVNKPAKVVEPTTYNSVLLGKNIEVVKNGGHVGLEGYLSGSRFPEQFYAEFDKKGISEAMVKKYGVDLDALLAMWQINSEASTGYGTAVHAALENYDRNYELGDKVKKVKEFKTKPPEIGENKALNRNAFLMKIVKDFHEQFGGDYIRFNEEFVWNKEFKLCGSIDRIKVIDFKKRIIRIQDYKTDADIHETTYQLTTSPFYKETQGDKPTMGKELLDKHWFQLSFYAFILERAGWTVEGLDIYWLNPEKLANGENAWEEFSREVIDITPVILGE